MKPESEDQLDQDRLPSGSGRRVVAILTLCVFLGAIFGTAVIDTLAPVPLPQLLGAEKNAEETRRRDARFRDGSLAALFERDRRLTSRVRQEILPYYSLGLYALLSEGNEHVVVGRDGWLFSAERSTPGARDGEQLGGLAGSLFKAVDRRLGTLGVERTIFLPIPRKVVVAEEFLPPGVVGNSSLDSLIIDGMIAKGCDTVDLRGPFAEREPVELYLQTDTHWTPAAAHLGATLLARRAGFAGDGDPRLGTLEVIEDGNPRNNHDLLASLGIGKDVAELGLLDFAPVDEVVVTLPEATEAWFADPDSRGPIALVGTSLSRWHRMAQLLTHYVGAPVWDGARAALGLLGSARAMLSLHRGQELPRLVFIEVPLHQLYQGSAVGQRVSFGPRTSELFAENPPTSVIELPGPENPWRRLRGLRVELAPSRSAPVAMIPPRVLAHSGEGVASVRVRGEVLGGASVLEVVHEEHMLRVELPAGTFDLVLPLLAPGPTTAPVRFAARSRTGATMVIESLTAVHEASPDAFVALELDSSAPAGTGVLIPPSPLPITSRSALLLTTGAGVPREGEVTIVVHSAGEVSWSRSFRDLLHGTWIALDLQELAGDELLGVELRTEPSAPGRKPLVISGGLVTPR